ncbi:MAG: phage holin family protein [Lautropia sp.]|nr:phage holin family protein [Lautropia sp.]
MRLFLGWAINAAAIFFLPYILDAVELKSFGTALLVALIIALLNTFIRPVLFILTLPINVLTLGLFTLILNGLMFWVTSRLVDGFTITGFWWAVLAALIYSIVSSLISMVLLEGEQRSDDRGSGTISRQ